MIRGGENVSCNQETFGWCIGNIFERKEQVWLLLQEECMYNDVTGI